MISLTILEEDYNKLTDIIFSRPGIEGAAYLLCGTSKTKKEYRFLVREVIPIQEDDYIVRKPESLSISSESFVRIAKKASINNGSVFFVHSHPDGYDNFSSQDNIEEEKLHKFWANRLPKSINGSIVFNSKFSFKSRIWKDKQWKYIERVRIIGKKFRFVDVKNNLIISEFFSRQILAFGPEIQKLLAKLHIGVVGAGGTGSPLIEQLTRLGIGRLSVFDGDKLEKSNISRLYGSRISDIGRNKAQIALKNVRRIGLKTEITSYPKFITEEKVSKKLKDCDIVFCCADTQWPRGALVQLSIRYLIPVLDMGVVINSKDGVIKEIIGRITTFFPGEACLFCRREISSNIIQLETLSVEERKKLVAQRYAPELDMDDPAIIMFTSAVASQAIIELLQRLTEFMGNDRNSTETLMLFDQTRIRTTRENPNVDCLCQVKSNWGKGDTKNYLGMTWTNSRRVRS